MNEKILGKLSEIKSAIQTLTITLVILMIGYLVSMEIDFYIQINFKDGTHKVYLVEGIEENSTYKSGDNFILEIKDDDSIILNFQDIESYRFIRKWGNDDKIKLH